LPNSPHTKNPGQMRSIGAVSAASGNWGPTYSPGTLVVFGPPGSFSTDGKHGVIPGLQLQMSTPSVAVEWGTAGMVVKHNQLSALPEVCILVQGFVGWCSSAAVFPVEDWIELER
jgi:hypothetical protein